MTHTRETVALRVRELEDLTGLPPGEWATHEEVVTLIYGTTGQWPGLFTVDGYLEARWIMDHVVVSATFADLIELYVYDRNAQDMVLEVDIFDEDPQNVASFLTDIIERNTAYAEENGYTSN